MPVPPHLEPYLDAPFLATLSTSILALLLLPILITDARTQRIPNWLNALLAIAGMAMHHFAHADLVAPLIGAVVGFTGVFVFRWGYRKFTGHDGIGLGDAKLLGAAGIWLGSTGLPFVILIGSSLGLAYVALKQAFGGKLKRTDAIAFGPFLCIAIFVVWTAFLYAP